MMVWMMMIQLTVTCQSFEELAQSDDLKDGYLMGEFDVIKVNPHYRAR